MEERGLPLDNTFRSKMIKVAFAIVAIAAALVAAKQSNALERAQLLSSCSEVAAPAGDDRSVLACRAGKLDGMPDLSLKSCESRGISGSFEYWSCPTKISSSRRTE